MSELAVEVASTRNVAGVARRYFGGIQVGSARACRALDTRECLVLCVAVVDAKFDSHRVARGAGTTQESLSIVLASAADRSPSWDVLLEETNTRRRESGLGSSATSDRGGTAGTSLDWVAAR